MTDYSIAPTEFARELESHGYESFWCGDHTHIPVAPASDEPILDTRTGKPLQQEYWHLMDPFVALANAAAVTNRILLGIGITLVNERDPIVTAKQVASLDHLSGGRFLFGIGGGWNVEEMANHGTDARFKWRIMRERVAAMKQVWTQDIAEYHGEFVNFSPLMSWPKPVQKPYPPILIGGNDRNIPRVVEYADGWAPGVVSKEAAVFAAEIAELQRRAAEAGRGRMPVTAFHITPVAGLEVGSELELSERRWNEYQEAGVDRVVVMFPPWREKNLPLVERLARFISPG